MEDPQKNFNDEEISNEEINDDLNEIADLESEINEMKSDIASKYDIDVDDIEYPVNEEPEVLDYTKKPEKENLSNSVVIRKNLLIALGATLFIILFLIGNHYLKEYNKEIDNKNKTEELDKFLNENKSYGTIYIIKRTATTEGEDSYIFTSTKNELGTNDVLVSKYYCQNEGCSSLDVDKKYLVIYDKKYYLFNYENISRKELNITGAFDEGNIVLDSTNKVKGIILTNSQEGHTAFYSYESNAITIRVTENDFIYNDLSLSKNYLFSGCNLYDFVSGAKVNSFEKISKDYKETDTDTEICHLDILGNGTNVYFVEYLHETSDARYVFNDSFELLFNGKYYNDIEINMAGDLVVNNGTYIMSYNNKSKDIKNSKPYEKVLGLLDKYAVVVKDEIVTLIDYNDNVITEYDKWNNNYKYNKDLTGYYKKDGKDIIYIVINNMKNNNQYEYYYIPSNGNSGKNENNVTELLLSYSSLYLYPLEQTSVNVTFTNENNLVSATPNYINGWSSVIKPSGSIYTPSGVEYKKLYYEEKLLHKVTFNEGFYVTQESSEEFFNDKLKIIGFNSTEIKEFKTYWLPIIKENKRNLVYFEFTKSRNIYSKFIITPEPDTLVRVLVHIKPLSSYQYVNKQELESYSRKGFTVLELGGVEYK